MENQTDTKPVLSCLAAAWLIGLLVCWYLPLEIFRANPIDFDSSWAQLRGSLAGWGVALAVALLLPAIGPSAWRRWYSTVLLAAALLVWISGTWVVGDFGLLDGTSFDLGRHRKGLIWQSISLFVVFLIFLYVADRWKNPTTTLVSVLALGLTISSLFVSSRLPTIEPVATDSANQHQLFRFSTEKNLLIVMMDTFQSDFFDSITQQEPDIAQAFEGFVYYPDTLGVAPSTYLTMPAFHSGQGYDYESPLGQYYDEAVKEGSFFVQLANHGYQVDLVNPIANVCPKGAHCHNQLWAIAGEDSLAKTDVSWLLDLSIFRITPGWTKAIVFDGSSGLFTRTLGSARAHGELGYVVGSDQFIDLYSSLITVDSGPPTARLIHLFNTHPPFVLDSDCSFAGHLRKNNRRLMHRQVRCALQRFADVLSALKAAGAYHQTMIVLVADTGYGSHYGSYDLANRFATDQGMNAGDMARIMGGANPVLAIKPPAASGKLQTHKTAAQLTDIAKTICTALGDCEVNLGHDLGSQSENKRPGRRYNYYKWENSFWSLPKIPGIQAFDVSGPLWREQSWQRARIGEMEQPVWQLGFSEDDSAHWFGLGWGKIEVNKQRQTSKRWATAPTAELILPLAADQNLQMTFKVFRAPDLSNQTISLSVNGSSVGTQSIASGAHTISFQVPEAVTREQMNEVELQFSDIRRPEGGERRSITAAFFELRIEPADL